MLAHEALLFQEYHCAACEPEAGSLTMRRQLKRRRVTIDYVALNEGDLAAIGTDKFTHPHIARMEEHEPEDVCVEQLESEITPTWVVAGGVAKPVLVKKTQRDSTGPRLEVPETLTVTEVAALVGADAPIEVMDVLLQNGCPGWTVGRWRDYFNSPPADRDRIRNVISLEVLQTPLGLQITRPWCVEALDLADRVWRTEDLPRPQVTKYALMLVARLFTDFHIDFGGTQVYYTVILGRKRFLLFPPSKHNLDRYERWCKLEHQNLVWLGDELEGGVKAELAPGDMFLIPAGWIHCVYTPSDLVVIGGNYLTLHSMATQLRIAEIEVATKVPRRFTFPGFHTIVWLAAAWSMAHAAELEAGEREALVAVLRGLELQLAEARSEKLAVARRAREAVPRKWLGDEPEAFVERFAAFVDGGAVGGEAGDSGAVDGGAVEPSRPAGTTAL